MYTERISESVGGLKEKIERGERVERINNKRESEVGWGRCLSRRGQHGWDD